MGIEHFTIDITGMDGASSGFSRDSEVELAGVVLDCLRRVSGTGAGDWLWSFPGILGTRILYI